MGFRVLGVAGSQGFRVYDLRVYGFGGLGAWRAGGLGSSGSQKTCVKLL